eukprot:CAMPEP_0202729682 /NCGR_PEP_ID=MMETSP1385-20130828/186259_1 /ASSEMBLY_ACC=CAM_ASM_000861 /TAXON_ID=933848 /ORGANISM="Elphidium margaritaceum" /LENGTH=296 /DNA_ID=CAMNT_0049395949 /DNA_START=51 /DNA_END=941 /DNA_ORIENTATION=+
MNVYDKVRDLVRLRVYTAKSGCSSRRSKCDSHCFCFGKDLNNKKRRIVRYGKYVWIWTERHEQAVVDSTTIPLEIALVIKTFAYNAMHAHHTEGTFMSDESAYDNNRRLSRKRLCSSWLSRHLNIAQSGIVAAFHTSKNDCLEHALNENVFLSGLSMQSLPALQRTVGDRRCTVFVDDCRVSFRLRWIDQHAQTNANEDEAMIHVLVLTSDDEPNVANMLCDKLWQRQQSMQNVVILQYNTRSTRKNKVTQAIADHWNVPYVRSTLSNAHHVKDFFNLLIKYYWFQDVNQIRKLDE